VKVQKEGGSGKIQRISYYGHRKKKQYRRLKYANGRTFSRSKRLSSQRRLKGWGIETRERGEYRRIYNFERRG